jgi:hypothetical protein
LSGDPSFDQNAGEHLVARVVSDLLATWKFWLVKTKTKNK